MFARRLTAPSNMALYLSGVHSYVALFSFQRSSASRMIEMKEVHRSSRRLVYLNKLTGVCQALFLKCFVCLLCEDILFFCLLPSDSYCILPPVTTSVKLYFSIQNDFIAKSTQNILLHKRILFVFFPHARISWFFYNTIEFNKSQQNMYGLYRNLS